MVDDEAVSPEIPGADPMHEDTADEFDQPEEVGKEINITADGGLKKKILVKGEGFFKPEAGDIVTVHYVGTLEDGSKFDSSRDRDDPFSFNLKQGSVIKGWDLGVASMKKGEKSVLICTAPYAYGDSGAPPKIPPKSTLHFEVELLSWKSVKDMSGDGGVMKTVTVAGAGYEKPADRDEVLVRYSARVVGQDAPFASSPSEGVEFTIQDGLEGIKGVSVAVKNMEKGEHASVVIKPEYAYGPEGRAGVVPGDATLEVELQLLSWKKVEDVTEDGLVVKKILCASDDWKAIGEDAKVKVRLTGRLPDGTVFDEYPVGQELQFTTDEEQVCEGLDLGVAKMKVNETSLLTVRPPYSFVGEGHRGRLAHVPPGTVVTYEVEVVESEGMKESWEMKDEEKVAMGQVIKEKGNKAFKEQKLARAARKYDKALSYVSYDKGFPEAIRGQSREIKRSAILNLAASHLKLKNWREAAQQCDKVLESEPENVKALYRRAQALMSCADFVEAELDVKRGLLVAPGDVELNALLKRLRVLQRDQTKKEAAMYSRMFKPSPAPKAATAGDEAAAAATQSNGGSS